MKVLLAHPGTQHSFNLAKQLRLHNVLHKFHTCIAFGKDSPITGLNKVLPKGLMKKIQNRIVNDLEDSLIHRYLAIELSRYISLRKSKSSEVGLFLRNAAFQRAISDYELEQSDVVIGFDTSSWILAERCKKLKKQFVLDVSIAHPLSKQSIYENLSRDYPDWGSELVPKKAELIAKEIVETELADKIVVPSTFVQNTYLEHGVEAAKIVVNPFGTTVHEFAINQVKSNAKCIFFFLGGLTARKGLPFLLETWRQCAFPNAELIIAGFGTLPTGVHLPENVTNFGHLSKKERNQVFEQSHVFVFPSFFEGLAQVQIEAMASGLPIIGTSNSGALDLVDEGVNGFVIESGNCKQLSNAMTFFVKSPQSIQIMGASARKKAEQFTWDAYGQRWNQILNSLC